LGNRNFVRRLVADDLEVPNNSMTQMMREKLAQGIKEFDAVLKPGGKVVFLGTPQTEQSIYGVLEGRGYRTRIWPARRPAQAKELTYGAKLAPMIVKLAEGSVVDPDRFPEADLRERELSWGPSGFSLQFMLDTTLSDIDRYPLKISDLVIMDCRGDVAPEKVVWSSEPSLWRADLPCVGFNGDRWCSPKATLGDWLPFTGVVMSIDPSGRGKDETSYAVVKILNGFLYVAECSAVPGGYEPETLGKLAEIAKRNKVNQIVVEANFGDGMFTELLKPVLAKVHPCGIDEVKHTTQKERRIIDTLEPVIASHRLVVDPKVVQEDYDGVCSRDRYESAISYSLFHQLSRITRHKGALRHDDRIDALAIAVGHWVESMAADADRRMESRASAALDKELRKFMATATGKTSPSGWISEGAVGGYSWL
jgi:hypothetical protein